MLKGIFILLISLLSIVFIYLFFQRKPLEFKEIYTQQELYAILQDTSSKDISKHCGWEYGHTPDYHLFQNFCLPKVEPGSFYTVEKRYKIKKELLKIDDVYVNFHNEKLKMMKDEKNKFYGIGLTSQVIIHWDDNITK